MILTIFTVVLTLGFLVFIHELGHFLAAKSVGVRVIEFSIGFPPKLVSKVVGKTEYLISLIPIGGYVRLKGQNIDDEDLNDPENYAAKTKLQRLLILVAGPVMNLLIAFIIMPFVYYIGYEIPDYLTKPAIIGDVIRGSQANLLDIQKNDEIISINGKPIKSWREAHSMLYQTSELLIHLRLRRKERVIERHFSSNFMKEQKEFGWRVKIDPVIGEISPNSPAQTSGLQKGDIIREINGTSIDNWSQISPLVKNSDGNPLTLVIERQHREMEISISPDWNQETGSWLLGISGKLTQVSENFIDSIKLGSHQVVFMARRTIEFLFRLITGKESSKSVGGPIMIAKMVGNAAHSGISNLLTLIGFISLQFGIFNLLPIPALDGGHILFLVIEKIKGGALSKGFRTSVQKIGFSLLLLLILFISVQDGLRLL